MTRFLSSLALAASLSILAVTPGHAADFDIEGKYELVLPPQPTESDPGRIEIVDIFWFGCPHCFRFLPAMEEYAARRPDDVDFRRMPAVFRESWVAHARAFYAGRILGVEDQIHRPLFAAIHNDKKKLNTRKSLLDFFGAHGVDQAKFGETFDSFAVESLVRKSIKMQELYGITGTPTVVVNGKYRVTGSLAGSYPNMIKVVEALVDKERKAQLASR